MTSDSLTHSPVLAVAKREWGRICHNRTTYFYLVGLPVILFVVLAYIYHERVVIDIPMAICDNDHSELSRMLTRSFDSDRSLKITTEIGSVDEAAGLLRRGLIQGAVFIPADLEADVKHGKSTRVVVYQNSSNIIIGNLITRAVVTVGRTVSTGIVMKKIRAAGVSEQQALDLANPIRIDTDVLYNPGYNYSYYLVPALLAVVLQMIVMISASQVVNSEYHDQTLSELMAAGNDSVAVALIGKALPHLAIHFSSALIIVGLIMPLFGIPVNGHIVTGVLFLLFFILTAFAVGMAISVLFTSMSFATEITAVTNTPAFMFCGYTFPITGMPGLHAALAQLLPFTHFLTGFIKVSQMNSSLGNLMPEIGKLSLFLVIAVALMATVGPRRLHAAVSLAEAEANQT